MLSRIGLSIEEWKFKDILRRKLIDLLHQQKSIGNKEVQSNGLSLEMQARNSFISMQPSDTEKMITSLKN
jgi:hypothetical protein